MSESDQDESGYVGVKFSRNQVKQERSSAINKEKELIAVCKFMADKGLAPAVDGGYAGNASFKTEQGMIITASGADLGQLKRKNLVEVVSCDFGQFKCDYCGAQKPSSETILHHMVYQSLPQELTARVILHGHYDPLVNNAQELGLPETETFQEYGTKELVLEVKKLLSKNPSLEFILKDHGFFVAAETIEQARDKVAKLYKRSQEL